MTRMTQPAGSARSPFLVPRQKHNVDRESCRELTVRNIPAVKRLSHFPQFTKQIVFLYKKKEPGALQDMGSCSPHGHISHISVGVREEEFVSFLLLKPSARKMFCGNFCFPGFVSLFFFFNNAHL